MRDIKFRGKHIHSLDINKKLDGIWVYGYLCSENYIWSDELCGDMLVDKNTIGQYTGLKDKNGVEIYEGDIVKNNWTSCSGKDLGGIWEVRFGEYDNSDLEYGSGGNIGFYVYNLKNGDEEGLNNLPCNNDDAIEVIGNIYEDLKESGE